MAYIGLEVGGICQQGCGELWVRHFLPKRNSYCPEYINRTAIGLRVKDGIVLAVEKIIHSKLLVPEANRRIQSVDRHIGMVRLHDSLVLFVYSYNSFQATSGFLADGRHLGNRARDEASNFRETFRMPPPLKVCFRLIYTFSCDY